LPQVSNTWDSCIETTITKLGYGVVGGLLTALVLFRAPRVPAPTHRAAPHARTTRTAHFQTSARALAGAPSARSAVVGLGAGVGVGMGYTDCKVNFDQIEKENAPAK
jgi:hypothetical protein